MVRAPERCEREKRKPISLATVSLIGNSLITIGPREFILAMFPTLVRRLAQATKPRLNAAVSNPTYKLKKVWPPDIKNMTSQQQLRFEKKYKRRLKLATARPRWDKFVRLAQLCTMTVVLIYVVLFMDWKDVPTPFDPVRPTSISLLRAAKS
jgi:hypothetical protein